MSEHEVLVVFKKLARTPRFEGPIPLLSKDADIIFAYCIAVKEVSRGCPECIVKKLYGEGKRCPIVVTLGA